MAVSLYDTVLTGRLRACHEIIHMLSSLGSSARLSPCLIRHNYAFSSRVRLGHAAAVQKKKKPSPDSTPTPYDKDYTTQLGGGEAHTLKDCRKNKKRKTKKSTEKPVATVIQQGSATDTLYNVLISATKARIEELQTFPQLIASAQEAEKSNSRAVCEKSKKPVQQAGSPVGFGGETFWKSDWGEDGKFHLRKATLVV